jgi:D-beta-D-heptose 7-phosphate kinase/D-beta-D-heptose 1-phosphate adenosyltransferase
LSSATSPNNWLERLRGLDLNEFSALKVLVAGDFMLDEYLWGRVERISPEAPVAVVDVQQETRTLGGAGNVVNNLVALGAQVEVLGLVGDDNPGRLLHQELAHLGVSPEGLFSDPGRRTSRKTRVIAVSQQVVRIDRETRSPAPPSFNDDALNYLKGLIPKLDAIILSDYGKGTLTPDFLKKCIQIAREFKIPVVVDPKGADYSAYAGASVITPNRKEAALAAGRSLERWEDLVEAGQRLRWDLSLETLLITLGAAGMVLFPAEGVEQHLPARDREVFDVSGAGDTVAAVMALGLARWRDPVLAASLANLAAGVVVGKIGTAPVTRAELKREVEGRGPGPEDKIVDLAALKGLVPHLKSRGQRIVFTNGCFDLLHVGHIKFLEESRNLGDVLVVAVDSDESVTQVKGPGRPVIGERERLRLLAALSTVDYVTLFATGQLPEILAALRPDILTKGANYPEAQVAGRDEVLAYGGQVRSVPIREDISSTDLINRIRQD